MNRPEVTLLLGQASSGDASAANQIFALVYGELRQMATQQMRNERPDHTLEATALVHEVWLKLVGKGTPASWNDRQHFFATAAQAMRRILVDAARARKSQRRGGEKNTVPMPDVIEAGPVRDDDVIALDDALNELSKIQPKKAELVCLRYFGGLTGAEAAKQLGISRSTADRDWVFAKAWLYDRINS